MKKAADMSGFSAPNNNQWLKEAEFYDLALEKIIQAFNKLKKLRAIISAETIMPKSGVVDLSFYILRDGQTLFPGCGHKRTVMIFKKEGEIWTGECQFEGRVLYMQYNEKQQVWKARYDGQTLPFSSLPPAQ